MQFEKICSVSAKDLIERQQAKEIELTKAKLKLATDQYQQKVRDYEGLKAETLKVVQGTSKLNLDILNDLVKETSETMQELENQIETAQAELQEYLSSARRVQGEYEQLISWAEMYDNCTFEAKKMIVAQFVKKVSVRRDYEIDIEFNVSFDEFHRLYLDNGEEAEKNKKSEADMLQTFA
jgi:hypothetical protein